MNSISSQTHALKKDVSLFAEHAGALLAATADVAGDQVNDARHRLSGVVDRIRDLYGTARDRAIERSHAADETAHENLYQTLAIGIGAGVLLGYLVSRQCRSMRR